MSLPRGRRLITLHCSHEQSKQILKQNVDLHAQSDLSLCCSHKLEFAFFQGMSRMILDGKHKSEDGSAYRACFA